MTIAVRRGATEHHTNTIESTTQKATQIFDTPVHLSMRNPLSRKTVIFP